MSGAAHSQADAAARKRQNKRLLAEKNAAQKKRMTDKSSRTFAVVATVIDLSALAVATVLALQLFRKLDGQGGRARDTSHKAKALASKLKGRPPLKVALREHELEVAADVVAPDEIDVCFEDIGGLGEVGKALQRNIILPFTRPELFKQSKLLSPPKGILLHGPPGTGKTLLARAVSRESHFTFICLNPARLLSKWYGESNKFAEAYFSLAHKLAPSILFIDEVDCLFRTRAGGGGGNEHEATSMLKAQFLSLWDGAPRLRRAHARACLACCSLARLARSLRA